jgi:hypothetical protein
MAATTILSPCKSRGAWTELGLNRHAHPISNMSNEMFDDVKNEHISFVSSLPFRPYTSVDRGGVANIGSNPQNTPLSTHLGMSAVGHEMYLTPLSGVLTAAQSGVTIHSEVQDVIDTVWRPKDKILDHSAESDTQLGAIKNYKKHDNLADYKHDGTAGGIGFDHSKTVHGHNEPRIVGTDVMYEPMLVVAVAQLSRAYILTEATGVWELDPNDTSVENAFVLAPEDIWKAGVIKHATSTKARISLIERKFTPMVGGLFSPSDFFSDCEFRMVGAELSLATGGVANNLIFCSTSELDHQRDMPTILTDTVGYDTNYDQMAMVRPGSRLTRNKAKAIFGGHEHGDLTVFRNNSYSSDLSRSNGRQTNPFTIGTVGPLSYSVAQVSVPITVRAHAHFEVKAKHLVPSSKPSPVSHPTIAATEAVVSKAHRTHSPQVYQNGSNALGTLLHRATDGVVDAITNDLMPSVINAGVRAASTYMGLEAGPVSSLAMIVD